MIDVGDSASTLVALVGQPGCKQPIEMPKGGFIGERSQYRLDGKSVTFTIQAGKITAVEEARD